MARKNIIRITAKVNGFRRCGVAHSAEPTDYDVVRFSREQLDILKAEQMLVVQEIEIEVPDGPAKKAK
ncbi:MAG: HI1506-related protein [Panacagrimonas sp.]